MQKLKTHVKRIINSKKVQRGALLVVGAFVLLNVIVGIIYLNKSYPKSYIANQPLGSVSYNDLESKISAMNLLPPEVTLRVKEKSETIKTEDIGITVDAAKTAETIKRNRPFIPVFGLMSYSSVEYSLSTDGQKLADFTKTFAKKYQQPAKNATFVLKDGKIQIADDKDGETLDADSIKQTISESVSAGTYDISLPVQSVGAKTIAKDLENRLETINRQMKTSITLTFGGKSKTFSPEEIATWYELEGSKAELADGNIQASVNAAGQTFGILVANNGAAVAAIKQHVSENKTLSFALKEAPKPTLRYTYCVAARGVSTSYLGAFSAKLASVYADSRGWGLKGQVTFSKVSSGCDFTAWLSAASQMPTFGAICDSTWSCRVGANVVINFDRWQNASPAWNANGGSLNDYRSMVINHETGHWFGYYHLNCGGAGQLAPVMQQQSINLQGCKFNPWPTTAELASHRRALGL